MMNIVLLIMCNMEGEVDMIYSKRTERRSTYQVLIVKCHRRTHVEHLGFGGNETLKKHI
jgi:hypothetical protein